MARGRTASVGVKYLPNTPCTIVFEYKTARSSAQGLVPKSTDANGAVAWSWTVDAGTTAGSWPVTVTCGGKSVRTAVTVP